LAGESKTEKATPKKRRDERKKGHVFLSKDAIAVASLFGSASMLRLTFVGIVAALYEMFHCCLDYAAKAPYSGGETTIRDIFYQLIVVFAKTAGPLLLVTVVIAVIATFAQTKMLVTSEVLKPKFNRISPLQGFKRLFSLRSIIEAAKGILKITVLLYLIYSCVNDMIALSSKYLYMDIRGSCQHALGAIFSMMLKVGLAFLVLAVLDFLYQWWDYEREMKMSKQEIKEEYKQTEGDPQVKGKIKEVQRKMAQARMMQQVPQADVVIRNPTHFAVALRYKLGVDDAPVVLAKGQDALALRIVKVAEENSIAVIENVAVARALYAKTELNHPIPPELYAVVAEVMVYLYKL
jgi:flagellar biosynthetic protein FlhB